MSNKMPGVPYGRSAEDLERERLNGNQYKPPFTRYEPGRGVSTDYSSDNSKRPTWVKKPPGLQ